MKLLLIIVIFCFSCNGKLDANDIGTANIVIVNKCQYVVYVRMGGGVAMVHAGNCNNQIHNKP